MKLVPLLLVATSVALSMGASARTQCKCESVNAVGEGNSSCSAAESKGACTIDFNQFGEPALQRAYAALKAFDPQYRPRVVDEPRGAVEALRAISDEKQLSDTIVLYMTVAVTAQVAGKPALAVEADDLKTLVAMANENKGLLYRIFGSQGADSRAQTSQSMGARLTYAAGCLDVQLPRGLRVMFKTSWSPVAPAPRCQGG